MNTATPNDADHPPPDSASEIAKSQRIVIQGAVLCGVGVLIGMIALVMCCYSLGVDFRGEGWGEMGANSSVLRRQSLIFSLVGFGIAIPLFWVGFFRITHPELSSLSQKRD